MDQIVYRSDLVLEAREFLKTTTYKGFWILKDGIINPKIYEALQNKFNKGEELSKLERIIADVASFYMGSVQNGESMPDGGYDSRLIKLYEAETGERAIIDNIPTESFKNWYDSQQASFHKKDSRSLSAVQRNHIKKRDLKQLILNQLQHYSRTGDRLRSLPQVIAELGWSKDTVRKHAKVILTQIFTDPGDASLIYEMIFGRIKVSYQRAERDCLNNNLRLITTAKQWFDMLKDRETLPSSLKVEVQCRAEAHKNHVRVNSILGCRDCFLMDFGQEPLKHQDILDFARENNLQAISFNDDSPLTEAEFIRIVEEYKSQHEDQDDYKSKSIVYINLRWKNIECGHIFERIYYNIQISRLRNYCPSCVSNIDQQRTFEAAEEVFKDYITQSLRSNEQLYKFLPERQLMMSKYQVISDPRCHVDVYVVIYVAGKEFKIAIEHQGPQHYSLISYISLARPSDIKRGIYKTDEQYEIEFNNLVARDKAKVNLFKDLNKDGYYLIVVPHYRSPSERKAFILREFIRQTKVNPNDVHITGFQ